MLEAQCHLFGGNLESDRGSHLRGGGACIKYLFGGGAAEATKFFAHGMVADEKRFIREIRWGVGHCAGLHLDVLWH